MMNTLFSWHSKHFLVGTSIILLLILSLSACSSTTPTTHGATTTGGGSGNGTTATTTPGIGLGTQPCPEAVKTPAHWDPIISTQNGITKVDSVTCGNLMGTATLQALVTVRYNGTGAILDVYVYTSISSPSPRQIFKLQNLYEGKAKISLYNSVLTAEVDQNSSINTGKDSASYTPDLFREFKWSDSVGTLVPVSFPGMYPDLTRYQAENDQAQVNQGVDAWKLDAGMVTQHMAADAHLLDWSSNAPTTIVSGGRSSDASAVVTVKNPAPGGSTVKVSLQRLEGNTNGGIWEVVAVTSDGMSIASPQSRDRVTSPALIAGTGNAFEGKIGMLAILDHLYNHIGHADVSGVAGNGSTTFATSVTYNSTFKGGTQEGIVILYAENNAGSSPAGAVMLKVAVS